MTTIPKVIHYCWFGGNPLPEMAIKCIASWKKFFPDYEIIEWNESNFDVNIIPYTAEAYRAKKYAFVSDYARFWILYNYGGLYFDTDVEVIRPFDDILEKGPFMGCELILNKEKNLVPIIAPGLGLGVEKGHDIYKKILDVYSNKFLYSWKGNITENVVTIVSKILLGAEHANYELSNICNIKGINIYPYDYFCPKIACTGELKLSENSRSIHLYAASWMSNSKRSRYTIEKDRFFHVFNRIFVHTFYKLLFKRPVQK